MKSRKLIHKPLICLVFCLLCFVVRSQTAYVTTTPIFNVTEGEDVIVGLIGGDMFSNVTSNGDVIMIMGALGYIDLQRTETSVIDFDNSELEDLKVFPNPTMGQLYLELTGYKQEKFSYKLFDRTGQLVLVADDFPYENEAKIELDVTSLADGMYYLVITSDNQRIIAKASIVKYNGR